MKTVTRSAPPKMTRARAAAAAAAAASASASEAANSETAEKPSKNSEIPVCETSTSEAVVGPATTSATTKITTISTPTSSTNITTTESATTTTTTVTTIPTTTFLFLPATQPLRQPPPIPVPPTPLDLDTLVARRVEAAASAGSASAPILSGEEDEVEDGDGEELPQEEVENPVESMDNEGAEVVDVTSKTPKTKENQLLPPLPAARLLDNFIFVCSSCFGSFRSEKDLAVHKYVVHQVASYVCSFYCAAEGAGKSGHGCDFVSQDREIFKKHEAMHLTRPEHYCAICLDIFDTEESLSTHITSKHGTFVCYVCGLVLPNRPLHSSHMVSYHREAALKCEVCPYKTYLKGPFERHVRNHRQYRSCTVEGCNEAFSSEERLEAHINRLHRNVQQHRCERCADDENFEGEVPTFYNLKRLQNHLVEVHGDSLLRCERCDFKAANQRALVLHRRGGCRQALDQRPHRCPEDGCEAAFRTEAHLTAHQAARHSELPPLLCPEDNCDRRFRSNIQLSRHQREAHPPDVEVVQATEEVDLAFLNELIGGPKRGDSSMGGAGSASISAAGLLGKPFPCRNLGCDANFGRRTELIKHERVCFYKKRSSAAAASAAAVSPLTSRKSSQNVSKGSRGRPKGSGRTSTSSSSKVQKTSRLSSASTSAAAASAVEAMSADEAATAIDSLLMMKNDMAAGGSGSSTVDATSSQGTNSSGGEQITTEVITHGMEHLGEHQYHHYPL